MPTVNTKILIWARETAGMDLSAAAHALQTTIEKLAALETGETAPTRPMLLKMSKAFRRSLLSFYLVEPPRKADRGEDFRTLRDGSAEAFEALVDAMVRDLRSRQMLVRTTMKEEEEAEVLDFVGSMTMEDGPASVRKKIVETLKFDLATFRRQSKVSDAFGYLRGLAEHSGIFVLLVGDLGSHHTALPVESFRGFAIADPIAPFAVINSQDAKSAWSFTLLHEIVHILLGQTGVSGVWAEKLVEQFCNDVGSEILLPSSELVQLEIDRPFDAPATLQAISGFAEERNISSSMVAYRLLKTGQLKRPEWKAIEGALAEHRANRSSSADSDSGPSYYVVRRHRLGDALLAFARRSIDAGALSAVKAGRVLGVKPRAVFPLLAIGTSQ